MRNCTHFPLIFLASFVLFDQFSSSKLEHKMSFPEVGIYTSKTSVVSLVHHQQATHIIRQVKDKGETNMMTYAQIQEVLTPSEITLVKYAAADLSNADKIIALRFCAENRNLIFGGGDSAHTARVVGIFVKKAFKVSASN